MESLIISLIIFAMILVIFYMATLIYFNIKTKREIMKKIREAELIVHEIKDGEKDV